MIAERGSPRLVSGEVLPAADGPSRTLDRQAASAADGLPDAEPDFLAGEGASPPRKASGALFWATAGLAAFLAFWVMGGHSLILGPIESAVRNSPGQALAIENVRSRINQTSEGSSLIVDGEAVNAGQMPLDLPAIVIHVAPTDGRSARYLLGTDNKVLAPGERYTFSSRLDAPAAGVASVSITFQEGSD